MVVYNIGHNILDAEDNVYYRVKGETSRRQTSRQPGKNDPALVNEEETRKTE